ncbi:ABC transporter ATP-binding protein [Pseudomonas monteilii]
MIEVDALSVQRGVPGHGHAVHLPSLRLAPGQVLAITGESGCGKSTLLEALGLLLSPSQVGRYRLDEVDVAALLAQGEQARLAELRAQRLGFILQNGGLLPFLDVAANIRLPRQLLGLPGLGAGAERAIEVLNLMPLLNKLPQALSIGERQRVACARAIAHQPRLLLADEPTAALDPHNAKRLFGLLLELARELQLAVLLVSHDWALVEAFGLPSLRAHSTPGETHFATLA